MCHKFNHELNWFSQAVVTADVKGTAPKEQLKSLERNLDVALTQYWLRRGITQQHSKSWVVSKLKVWPKLIYYKAPSTIGLLLTQVIIVH